MLDGPALQRTPLELEPELAGFHGFCGKTLEGLFEPLVYFTNRTGDLFFSTLPLSLSIAEPIRRVNKQTQPTSQDHCNWNHSSILAENRLCHCNHMICSDFRWVKRRRISHYRTICFVFNVACVCPLCSIKENILSSTAPAKQNSKKSGI